MFPTMDWSVEERDILPSTTTKRLPRLPLKVRVDFPADRCSLRAKETTVKAREEERVLPASSLALAQRAERVVKAKAKVEGRVVSDDLPREGRKEKFERSLMLRERSILTPMERISMVVDGCPVTSGLPMTLIWILPRL
jgi:hypothetical protein